MLRASVICLGALLIVAGVVVLRTSVLISVELAVLGAVLLFATLFERRYRARRAVGAGWETTAERFIDPTSGKAVEVRYKSQTGERAYVTEGDVQR